MKSPQQSRRALGAAGLVLATLVAYLPALQAGYIWDDDAYLTENPELGSLAGLGRLWIPGVTPQYYPAVFTSFWVEHQLWGLHPLGYHLVNVLLHAVNALLVVRLAGVLRLPGPWLLGWLFALHPLHVESVAWVTERKNVLSGCCYLLAALCFLRSQEVTTPRPRRWYLGALGLFVLALLSKTVTCSLPAALVLMGWWRGERLTAARWRALLPMFAVGLILALHTAYLERTLVGAAGEDFQFSLLQRLEIASRALLFYPAKLLWPASLMFVYPRWELGESALWAVGVPLLVLGGAVLAVVAARRGRLGVPLALAYYAGTLFPALGFFNVYPMRFSFVADHFAYLASLGVLALMVAVLVGLPLPRAVSTAGSAALLLVLAGMIFRQGAMYADEETLWRTTLRDNPGAWMAHNNLAELLADRGEDAAALVELEQALHLVETPATRSRVQLNRALVRARLGRMEESLADLLAVQELSGGMEWRLARTLERLGRGAESRRWEERALAAEEDPRELLRAGLELRERRRPAAAIPWFEKATGLAADPVDAWMFLADAHFACGDRQAAVDAADQARRAVGRGRPSLANRIRQARERYLSGKR